MIYERTAADLRDDSRPIDQDRASPVDSQYQSVEEDSTIVEFTALSITTPGVSRWDNRVLADGLPELVEEKRESEEPLRQNEVREKLMGDIKVSCSCPAFDYWGFRYIATQDDFVLGREENRFPDIRNPQLEGTVCKHLVNTLRVLAFNAGRITKDLKDVIGEAYTVQDALLEIEEGSSAQEAFTSLLYNESTSVRHRRQILERFDAVRVNEPKEVWRSLLGQFPTQQVLTESLYKGRFFASSSEHIHGLYFPDIQEGLVFLEPISKRIMSQYVPMREKVDSTR